MPSAAPKLKFGEVHSVCSSTKSRNAQGRCGLGKNNSVDGMALLKEAETRPFYKEIETENTINCPGGGNGIKGDAKSLLPNGTSDYNLVLIFQWFYYTPQTGKT